MPTQLERQIGSRIRARREAVGLTQDELAEEMGFNNRQTLGAVEAGERSTRPEELVAAARALDVPLDYFTDRFIAAGEAAFSFRTEAVEEPQVGEVEERAGRWLATYRELAKPSLVKRALSLSTRSSYEDAQQAGEQIRRDLGLGQFPARELEEAITRTWNVLVLYVDLPEGVSGAASRLEGVQAILVNRTEPRSRRHYDLAHELFHLLTWDTMPPPRIETGTPARGERKRVEQLANNFAAALLMPSDSIRESWERYEDLALADRIAALADAFEVSGPAMKWRLHNLGLVARSALPEDAEIADSEKATQKRTPHPLPFNASFVHRIHRAVEEGDISVRKAARILDTDSAGLAELCRSYGRPLSYEI